MSKDFKGNRPDLDAVANEGFKQDWKEEQERRDAIAKAIRAEGGQAAGRVATPKLNEDGSYATQ